MPLLFLPNLGVSRATSMGTLELADYLMPPYFAVLSLAAFHRQRLLVSRLLLPCIAFVLWTLISTVTIGLRYDYLFDYQIKFGLLKLAKFGLYFGAGVLTVRALGALKSLRLFNWSVLACGLVTSISLFFLGSLTSERGTDTGGVGYKAGNAISVLVAILLVYLAANAATKRGSPLWQRLTKISLVVMIPGFLFSDGRGGWVAALVGAGYVSYRLGFKKQVLVTAVLLGAPVVMAYSLVPEFRSQIENTLWPDEDYLEEYNVGVGGVDDGGRLSTWLHEGVKLSRAPLLGTGFFHRAGRSGLWETGSHNFWLQMYLETGLIGGSLLLLCAWKAWKQAGSGISRQLGLELPVRSALLVAFVGGLGGEYYYGSIVLFGAFLVYAPVGALSVASKRSQPRTQQPSSASIPAQELTTPSGATRE